MSRVQGQIVVLYAVLQYFPIRIVLGIKTKI